MYDAKVVDFTHLEEYVNNDARMRVLDPHECRQNVANHGHQQYPFTPILVTQRPNVRGDEP